MTKKRSHGEGTVDTRGEDTHRLRYRVKGQRFTKTFHGTLTEARKELRRLLRTGDTGEHIAPDRITVGQWIQQWIAAGAPGRRKKRVGRRTLERYEQLLRVHVAQALGERPLQQLLPTEIDALYTELEEKIAPMTAHHVHTVLGACLGTAVRKGLIPANPLTRAEKIPSAGEGDHGIALDEDELHRLLDGFKGSVMYPIVAVLALTGARRGEVLALRWSDLDVANKTLRIERAVEQTKKHGLVFKEPKTARGKRVFAIDDGLLTLLQAEREKALRFVAGVPTGAAIDLSLVKLPEGALMFPNPSGPGEEFSLVRPRNPRNTSKEIIRRFAKLGFPDLRLHDLRGTHETLLLDSGVPLHVVAARGGQDPATVLRNYAKRTRKADVSAAAAIGELSKGILGS